MTRRGLPLAAIFTLGNQADIDIADMLDALADDERITAIGLHIEGLRDVGGVRRAPRSRPATTESRSIALKTGRSEQGAKVAMSHTTSLAGSDTLYDALFERYGIARVTIRHRLRRDAEVPAPWRRPARPPLRLDELLGRRGGAGGRSWRLTASCRFPPFDGGHRRQGRRHPQ